ncbi:MAG: HlyD family efflux transporter periplasmic adaptor subunit [Pseudomonadales bacterium]|nr:HlyD family efflux transporter periplasmic adaptor subunit [Pseudomonadales bacterium]
MAASRRRLWGDLLLTQPPGTGAVLALVLGLVIAAGALLCFGEFTRTVRVSGYLVPDGGVLGVRAPLPGLVAEVLVAEGDLVAEGQPLVRIVDPRALDQGPEAGEAALDAIDAQLARIASLRATEAARLERERSADEGAFERARRREAALRAQQAALDAQLELADRTAARLARLARAGHVTRQQLEAAERERLTLARERAALEDGLLVLDGEAAMAAARLADWSDRRRRRLAELDDRRDALRRERIELGGRVEFWLRAPRDGRVASLGVVAGEPARPGRDLMTLLAPEARMHAVLLVPSRAIGFVAPGQEVRLLYDAFPYTRFGAHGGEVVGVGRSILAPEELDAPARVVEPVYKVRVRPEAGEVLAYGRSIPLQAGMALEADLRLERRRLWRWLFEPLLALRGRL